MVIARLDTKLFVFSKHVVGAPAIRVAATATSFTEPEVHHVAFTGVRHPLLELPHGSVTVRLTANLGIGLELFLGGEV